MKTVLSFWCGALVASCAVMLYVHGNVIAAAINGEEIPKAPEGCPVYKKEDEDE